MSENKKWIVNFDYLNINNIKVLGRILPNKVKDRFCLNNSYVSRE